MHCKSIVVLALIALLAAGCLGPNSQPAPGQAPGEQITSSPEGTPLPEEQVDSAGLPENTLTQKVDNLTVSLALSPYPPAGFQKTDFDVTLTDENGKAITDATVTLDLTMPSMYMPPNTPEATLTDEGVYHASGTFTMGGGWQIEVIIQRGDQKQSAFFKVSI
jgi:hypothetical protein